MTVRVGAVEHDELHTLLAASLHDVEKCTNIGVKPRAHILDVKNHRVQACKIFGARFFVPTVERHDGRARARIRAIADVLACIGFAAKTMFGRKNARHTHAQRVQRVGQVRFPCARSVIDHQPDLSASEHGQERVQALGPDYYALIVSVLCKNFTKTN